MEKVLLALHAGSVVKATSATTIVQVRFTYCSRTLVARTLMALGPVVQSIVRLTSSLRGQLFKCFTTL